MTIGFQKGILSNAGVEVNESEDTFRSRAPSIDTAVSTLIWGSVVPLTGLLAISAGVLVFLGGWWLTKASVQACALLACMCGGIVLVLGVCVQWYVIATRVRRPLQRLDMELRGTRTWAPEKDLLLRALRESIEETRATSLETRGELSKERDRHALCRRRLSDCEATDRFFAAATEQLAATLSLADVAVRSVELVAEQWPDATVMLLQRTDTSADLESLAAVSPAEGPKAVLAMNGRMRLERPAYAKATLPLPLKEAFRSGTYLRLSSPVSQDPALPDCRSFLALGLEHRGAVRAVLYAASNHTDPPGLSALVRARPFLSMAYSRAMMAHELEDAALRDSLTGAFTQNHFLSLLRAEITRANRYAHPVCCALIDIDDLRRINTRYGAPFGDRVIAETARLVQEHVRTSDVVARVSGGRFAVLFPESSADMAHIGAERVRARVEGHTYLAQRGEAERLTVSVGLAAHPPHGVTALSLMDVAHSALTAAKEAGRNRVVVASE